MGVRDNHTNHKNLTPMSSVGMQHNLAFNYNLKMDQDERIIQ